MIIECKQITWAFMLVIAMNQSMAFCQKINELGKYSYAIFIYRRGENNSGGTGFLLEKGKQTFLVSNYHVLLGWDAFSGTLERIDSVVVKLRSKLDSILITLKIIKRIDSFSVQEKLDLYITPIDLPGNAKPSFINEILDSSYFNKVPKKIYCFGFNANGRHVPTPFFAPISHFQGQYLERSSEIDSLYELHSSEERFSPDFVSKYNRINYYISEIQDLPLYKVKGYSGAPVIGEFEKTNGGDVKKVYRFYGVQYAANERYGLCLVIRPEICLKYLYGSPVNYRKDRRDRPKHRFNILKSGSTNVN